MRVLGNPRATVLKDTLRHLRDFVNALGGVPDARTVMGIRSVAASGMNAAGRRQMLKEAWHCRINIWNFVLEARKTVSQSSDIFFFLVLIWRLDV